LMLTVLLRTVFFYFFLLLVLRLMGKRELGSLGPLELVITFIMAEAAAIPIENPERPLVYGIIPILTLMALELILSKLCLISATWRHLISGRPTVVIENGRFVVREMRRLRYTINDLLEQLRQKGYDSLSDVDTAILESNGELSVLPKEAARPLRLADIGLAGSGIKPCVLVIDGQVQKEDLAKCGIDEAALHALLQRHGCRHTGEVLFAGMDNMGKVFVQRKE